MKCPKCGYLGFETSERCRNCGYDFSLATHASPASELPLHSSEGAGAPLQDFDLADVDRPDDRSDAYVDLDGPSAPVAPDAPSAPNARNAPSAPSAPSAPVSRAAPVPPASPASRSLPLFSDADDVPLIATPRPAGPPLSVRRPTPEIPRVRSKTVTPRPGDNALTLQTDVTDDEYAREHWRQFHGTTADLSPASAAARLTAAIIDVTLLGAINAVVVYLTLALSGLTVDEIRVLPVAPVLGFLAILDGGYLIAFIAASGQTIGKMITGIRVMSEDGRRVEVGGAVLRAAGCGVSLLTAGLGYLPAFLTSDRRALQDRISGTRVVSAR